METPGRDSLPLSISEETKKEEQNESWTYRSDSIPEMINGQIKDIVKTSAPMPQCVPHNPKVLPSQNKQIYMQGEMGEMK